METTKWTELREHLLTAGWTLEKPGSDVLESPNKTLAVSPELETLESRSNFIRSVEQSLETIRDYQSRGHDLERMDVAVTELQEALAIVRKFYAD